MALQTKSVLSRARACIRIEQDALSATGRSLGPEFVATARAVAAVSEAGGKLGGGEQGIEGDAGAVLSVPDFLFVKSGTATLEAALGVKRTEAMVKLQEVTGMDAVTLQPAAGAATAPLRRAAAPAAAAVGDLVVDRALGNAGDQVLVARHDGAAVGVFEADRVQPCALAAGEADFAAVVDAHAPLPQAAVSPTPRSCTRSRMVARSTTCM